MLELKRIKKDYPAGGETVHALKGVSLRFRDSEFVSILGPSGCGKTTMLNIIGGLDQYSEGDLVINGVSTRNYRDRDWDAYRNHSVGFVFQSYNLIPHQSVLQNVELALTLSGVSKAERRRRAKEALEKVGLGDQLKKRPSEMSGGQMQRVAIARAIVNDPDIVLADEPTGALDSETSVQVMEILKEISCDRLVIMVTHNPELAEQYSTRIVRMLDGEITADSAPPTDEEMAPAVQPETVHKTKKPAMAFHTAFGLSLKNLFTKKGRTTLTAFAGSIGIIGIALITAVSNGMTTYIDAVQEDTLASYPLMLEAQHMDIGTLMATFINTAQSDKNHDSDAVYEKPVLHDLVNALNSVEAHENDLHSFKKWLEAQRADEESPLGLHDAVSGVQYTYNMDMLIYTKTEDGTILHSDTSKLMQTLLTRYFGQEMMGNMGMTSSNSMMSSMMLGGMSSSATLWQEMLAGDNGKLVSPLLEKQYDVVYGSWPTEYNEVVLVVDENNEVNDMALYALGLISEDDINAIVDAAINKETLDDNDRKWTYEEICNREFRTILGADCYTKDEKTGLYTDLRETNAGLKYLYDNGTVLKVSGIVRKNEDALSGVLTGSIGYTGKLREYVIEKTAESPALKAQLESKDTDIFNGLPFRENAGVMTDKEKETEFRNYIAALNNKGKAEAYVKIMCIPSQAQIDATVKQTLATMDRAAQEQMITQGLVQQTGMSEEEISSYIADMSDEDLEELFTQAIVERYKAQYAAGVKQQLAMMTEAQLAGALNASLRGYTTEQCAVYYEEVLVFSDASYEDNLRVLSYVDPETPAAINLYAASFADKDIIEEAIAEYNDGVEELSRITYTDYVGLMMSSVTTIINAITYVLISFVAVSLIVSSIMIGVITLISVQERTKEIGILRAIGASKRNVSSMFNAETMIIGFASGLLGVGLTYLLCIPINLILHALTGIPNLNAILPPEVGVLLIIISVLLTLFAGIIPSRSAARKDPVVALRTE